MLGELAVAARPSRSPPSASPTSARPIVVWDRRTGEPLHRAIVWQDRRTAARCDELRDAGHLPLVRDATGLVLDPYFSAHQARVAADRGRRRRPTTDLAFGTIDSWLLWKLTGGARARHRRRRTPAARCCSTSATLAWSAELCDLFGVPMHVLPEVRPSSGRFGVDRRGIGAARRRPDQRHRRRPAGGAVRAGLLRAGHDQEHLRHRFVRADERGRPCPDPVDGLLTTVALGSSADGDRRLRLRGRDLRHRRRGAVAARRARHHRRRAPRSGRWPRSIADTEGVYLVPAFTGLGSPWWDPYARGTIVGITRGTGRAHLARAVVEAMAYQTRDVVDAMTRGVGPPGRALARRRRRVGRWTCCCSCRPTSCRCPSPGRRAGDHRARRGLPRRAWPKACGARPTTSPPTGGSTPSSTPEIDPGRGRRRTY